MPAWGRCYACGSPLAPMQETVARRAGQADHFLRGQESLRWRNRRRPSTPPTARRPCGSTGATSRWRRRRTGPDTTTSRPTSTPMPSSPLQLYFEVRDTATRDYWTRVNYTTIVPPGSSTLIIPTSLYVGEKSRPGRPLMLGSITRMVFSIGEKPEAPLFVDNIRLERDTETARRAFRRAVGLRRRARLRPGDGRVHAAGRRQALQPGPGIRLEGRPLLADLRRLAAGSALPGLHLRRRRRPGHRRAQRQVPRFCQHGLAVGILGRVSALPPPWRWCSKASSTSTPWTWTRSSSATTDSGTRRTCPRRTRSTSTRCPTSSEKRYDVEVSDGQLNIEFRRPELGLLRVGDRRLSPDQGGRGRAIPRVRQGPAAIPLRQLLQAGAAHADRRAARAADVRDRSAASSSSRATG